MNTRQAKQYAEALAAEMTVEELASQLSFESPAIPRLGIPAYNWWSEALHGVARAGTATVLPQAIGLAAAFDTPLVREAAQMIGVEARAKYNAQSALGDRDVYKGLTFWSPNINIFRDPRWGRGQETYGEDPYLAGSTGVAFARGLQGEPDADAMLAAACAKHFAVHSGPEQKRHGFDAQVSEKDLRETYLPAFEMLVRKGQVEAVMGAYNRVNGEPCCGSPKLLQRILREEWGFDGHVVSDCGAIRDIHEGHGVTDTAPESAALALRSGCDLNCGSVYLQLLVALREGLVTAADIRRSAERVLATRARLGLIGGGSAYDAVSPLENDTEEHTRLALRVAQESMVLLKNDGILPLCANNLRTIAVIGPNADSVPCLEGNYNGKSSRYVTFLAGIRKRAGDAVRVLYAEGSHLYKPRVTNEGRVDDRLAEAVAAAQLADVVILCLGMSVAIEGEEGETDSAFCCGDRADLRLPAPQERLLQSVLVTGKPVVLVLASGSALCVEEGNAILQAWYPGQAGGDALASILFGDVSPSGRLPITFYRGVEELPPFEDYAMRGRTYRYCEQPPLYPFGYGLSYTRFAYRSARLEGERMYVCVANVGTRDGVEVVQVYAKRRHPQDALHPSLVGFARVALRAGESAEVVVPLWEHAFTVVDEAGRRVPCQQATFFIGGSQPDERSLYLTGGQPITLTVE